MTYIYVILVVLLVANIFIDVCEEIFPFKFNKPTRITYISIGVILYLTVMYSKICF